MASSPHLLTYVKMVLIICEQLSLNEQKSNPVMRTYLHSFLPFIEKILAEFSTAPLANSVEVKIQILKIFQQINKF